MCAFVTMMSFMKVQPSVSNTHRAVAEQALGAPIRESDLRLEAHSTPCSTILQHCVPCRFLPPCVSTQPERQTPPNTSLE